jgi:hypothetical protein
MPYNVKVTQLQVGHTSVVLSRDVNTNELLLQDGSVATAQPLVSFAGLRNVEGCFVVGRDGTGAQYTTIAAALAAIPGSSSAAIPSVVLVCPGTYSENLTIDRDGVTIMALGQVTITPATNNPTVKIQAGASTVPQSIVLDGLKIVQSNASQACVLVQGAAASTVAGGAGVTIRDCWLNPTGSGAHGLSTDRVGTVRVTGGKVTGDVAADIVLSQTNSVVFEYTDCEPAMSYVFDDTGEKPNGTATGLRLTGCRAAAITLNQVDATTSVFQNSTLGDVTVAGTQGHSISNCTTGTLTIDATSTVESLASKHAAYAGAGVFDLLTLRGVSAVVGDTSVVVSLGVVLPDETYSVVVTPHEIPSDGKAPAVTARQVHQFTVSFTSVETLAFSWVLFRD